MVNLTGMEQIVDTEPKTYTVVVHLAGRRWWQKKQVTYTDAIGTGWVDSKQLVVGRANGSASTFTSYEVTWVDENK